MTNKLWVIVETLFSSIDVMVDEIFLLTFEIPEKCNFLTHSAVFESKNKIKTETIFKCIHNRLHIYIYCWVTCYGTIMHICFVDITFHSVIRMINIIGLAIHEYFLSCNHHVNISLWPTVLCHFLWEFKLLSSCTVPTAGIIYIYIIICILK